MALMVSGLGAGTELTGWKGKGTSHPPSQMPAVTVFSLLATTQVCTILIPNSSISSLWGWGLCSPAYPQLRQLQRHPCASWHLRTLQPRSQ